MYMYNVSTVALPISVHTYVYATYSLQYIAVQNNSTHCKNEVVIYFGYMLMLLISIQHDFVL